MIGPRKIGPERRPRRGLARGCLAATLLFLAACEDASVITRTHREVALDAGAVRILASGGLPTEIHGLPWPETSADETIAQLRLPNAFPPSARFRRVDPAPDPTFRDRRLVLLFNDPRPPDEWGACDMGRTLARGAAFTPSYPQSGEGFEVFAVFCDGTESIGRGHLRAPGVAHGDWSTFQNEMRRLIRAIVTDFKGGENR